MASVLLRPGYEFTLEPAGGVCYHDPDDTTSGQLSLRRYMVGLRHTPSPQVAAELHLHSGAGDRHWTAVARPFEVDGAPATLRPFSDVANRLDGAVIVAELGETLLSVRAMWQAGLRSQRDELLTMATDIRLLALEDLAVPRRSQLHPVFSISVARPDGWRITEMTEDNWEFTFPTGTCTLRELDTGDDLSRLDAAGLTALLTPFIPAGAEAEPLEYRPTATAARMWTQQWRADGHYGVAAVLARALPVLIDARTSDPNELGTLLSLVDSVRSHPILH